MVSRAERGPLAEWFWTIDRFFLAVFVLLIGAGFMLSFAASPAVAERIGLDSFHFAGLVRAGLANEAARSQRSDDQLQPVLTAKELQELHREFHKLLSFSDDFVATYKGLIFQMR